jgi:hypothetical protein
MRVHTLFAAAFMLALIAAAPARALEPGDDQYPNSIIAPEPGSGSANHARRSAIKQNVRTLRGGGETIAKRSPYRRMHVAHGSSGSVLPTPLPRTELIPPEGGGAVITPPLPEEQGATVLPGMNPVPNLPHGAETFQDRASRCAHQAGLYGVPNTAINQYMSVCSM